MWLWPDGGGGRSVDFAEEHSGDEVLAGDGDECRAAVVGADGVFFGSHEAVVPDAVCFGADDAYALVFGASVFVDFYFEHFEF